MYKWKVCPIQGRQLKDVRPEDIYGNFRICKTYRSGGGYDELPDIIQRRMPNLALLGDLEKQFVVQLYGCHLKCPYCYVTEDGIFGVHVEYPSQGLVNEFNNAYREHNCGVFHLMGGAPALYIEYWPDILDELSENFIFHSDLLLTEKSYPRFVLEEINRPNAIYAVNIKGTDTVNYRENTGKSFFEKGYEFHTNFERIVDMGLNFYLTFTNPNENTLQAYMEDLAEYFGEEVLKDAFVINLVDYKALESGNAF